MTDETLVNFRSDRHLPGGAGVSGAPPSAPVHRLDKDAHTKVLAQIEDWWIEARDLHAESRREMLIDADFYDHEQYSPEDRATLLERGQAPLVFNLVHPVVDWLIGTERRTRIDFKIHPRGEEDVDLATVKEKLIKFQSDTNRIPFHRSLAFEDAVKVGVGWVEEYLRTDQLEEPVGYRYQDWRGLWWDPYSRALDMSDCRYLHRAKYIDLDYALAMFPDRHDVLMAAAVNYLDADLELLDDETDLPSALSGHHDRLRPSTTLRFGSSSQRTGRRRVRLIETQYRRPRATKKVIAAVAGLEEFIGRTFVPSDPQQDTVLQGLIADRKVGLIDAVTDELWQMLWTPGTVLEHGSLPYRHGKYTFTPVWFYRRSRDGMPYGSIRGLRDPQEEYNKRRSKALFAMSTNRVMFEAGAFDEDDEDEQLEELAKPNGQVRTAEGALSGNKIEVTTNLDVANSHVALMEQARNYMFEGSGVTRENLGQDSNAQSGRAVLAKQQQGAVSTAKVFDQLRLSVQISGEKLLSNIEQYMTLPAQVRVIGPRGELEWLFVNQPTFDPDTGEVVFANDITASRADFVVDQQDYRETVRMAMAESLFQTMRGLPPEIQLQLLDLAIELTDLPNRDELVRRIRAINGQTDDDGDLEARKAAEAEAAARAASMTEAERQASVRKTTAQAEKLEADAAASRVGGRRQALDTAALIAGSLPFAPAADRLYEGNNPQAATPAPSAPPTAVA